MPVRYGRSLRISRLVYGAGPASLIAFSWPRACRSANVAVNYLSKMDLAADVVDHIRKMGRNAMPAQADVADYPDTHRMAREVLEEFGHLDILINNEGINSDHTFVRMDLKPAC